MKPSNSSHTLLGRYFDPRGLTLAFVGSMLIPSFVLCFTEGYSFWRAAASLLFPTGFYLLWAASARRTGRAVLWGTPLLVLAAFEMVILYLFGGSIIAVDMFTNLITTSPGEAGELLGNLWPMVVLVCIIYIPVIAWAVVSLRRRQTMPRRIRLRMAAAGILLVGVATATCSLSVYPANVLQNIYLAGRELRTVARYEHTSAGFGFDARRTDTIPERRIFVVVIGEASRAANWSLFGYGRPTNPRLGTNAGVVPFANVLTQSNATHKSVPLFLSAVGAADHSDIYRQKGIAALFREAGYRTAVVSNQAPNHGLIQHLMEQADTVRWIAGRYDEALVEGLREEMARDAQDLLVVLHAYGSHYCYNDRYPAAFSHFRPDDEVSIARAHVERMRNAYDNSIRYTDHILADAVDALEASGAVAGMLYVSDHGEDLFDDERGRFLHASPTTTYYQLHVAAVAWFSTTYRERYPDRVAAARANRTAPATTHAVFHTLARIASIASPYVRPACSLVDTLYDASAPRRYLDDHSKAVPFSSTGLNAHDREELARRGIAID